MANKVHSLGTRTGEPKAVDDLYRDLVEEAGDYIFSSSSDGRITCINAAARRALGYDDDSIGDLRLAGIVAPEHVDRLSAIATSKDANLDPFTVELDLTDRTGGRIRTEASCRRAGAGEAPAGLYVIARDVTYRQELVQPSDCSANLLSTLLQNSPDLIYFKDLESRFVAHSRSFSDLLGLPEDIDLTGKTDFDLFKADHAQEAYADEQRIIQTGVPIVAKAEKETHPDGTVTWALTSKMPWRDESGRIIGTFGISKNITSLKEAEAKLEELHNCLVKTSRMAGMAEVANDVLHNVGNVLTSINVACSLAIERVRESRLSGLDKLASLMEEKGDGLSEFIANNPAGKRIPDYVAGLRDREVEDREYLRAELEQLREKIDHIKRIVAMQQNYAKVAGAVETVSVFQLIEDAIQINSAALYRHQVATRQESEDVPALVTDKHKVLQILVNLISNAKYAMDEIDSGDRILTIRVARNGPEEVRIEVADNGVGIPRENLTLIFSHGFTTRAKGHGFGLHSAALTARELGGSIEAHSEGHGKGAVLTLILPITWTGDSA